MIAKMTAVEWLVEQLKESIGLKDMQVIEKAKEMEKQQRQKDFIAGNDSACMEHENIEDYFKQYIKSE